MYNPIRAGTRGGAAEFKWSDVKEDKDREQYLGHSILAPKGRWQNNKDITWYNKDNKAEADERAAEIRKIKEQEEDALSVALGFAPTIRAPSGPHPSGSNAINTNDSVLQIAAEKASRKLEKEERKKDRAGRREEKEKLRAEGGASSSRNNHRSSKRHGSEEFEKDLRREDSSRRSGGRNDDGSSSRREDDRPRERRRDEDSRGSGRDRYVPSSSRDREREDRNRRERSRSRSPRR